MPGLIDQLTNHESRLLVIENQLLTGGTVAIDSTIIWLCWTSWKLGRNFFSQHVFLMRMEI